MTAPDMPFDGRTPFFVEGLEWFVKEFRGLFQLPLHPGLLPPPPYVNSFSEESVGRAYEGIQMTRAQGYSTLTMGDVARTARAANYSLSEGAKVNYEKVAGSFFSVAGGIPICSNAMVDRRNAIARRGNAGDALFNDVLNYYHALYEELSPSVLAPIVYAAQVRERRDVQFPKDGKADFKFLQKMQEKHRPEDRLFLIGRDRHVRNAISHRRVEFLDGGKVRLSEKNGRWSEEFTLREIIALCDTLWINSKAVSLGHMIFYGNNFASAARMGLVPDRSPLARSRDREEMIRNEAKRFGLTAEELQCAPNSVSATLRMQQKGIPHPELHISGDGSGGSVHHRIDAKVIRFPVRTGVTIILLAARRAGAGDAHIRVIRHSGEKIAEIRLSNMESKSEEEIQEMDLGIPEKEITWVELKRLC